MAGLREEGRKDGDRGEGRRKREDEERERDREIRELVSWLELGF